MRLYRWCESLATQSIIKLIISMPSHKTLKTGKEDEVYTAFQRVPHVTVYRKEDIPSEYHYKWNDRILPLLVEAEEGYNMVQERTEDYTGMNCQAL